MAKFRIDVKCVSSGVIYSKEWDITCLGYVWRRTVMKWFGEMVSTMLAIETYDVNDLEFRYGQLNDSFYEYEWVSFGCVREILQIVGRR